MWLVQHTLRVWPLAQCAEEAARCYLHLYGAKFFTAATTLKVLTKIKQNLHSLQAFPCYQESWVTHSAEVVLI